jgi:beta-lactamase regulating signal transducer with metallopeptidase domain
MTAAVILHGLAISAFLACAAWAADRLFVLRCWPRRGVWFLAILASIAVPVLAILVERNLAPARIPSIPSATATAAAGSSVVKEVGAPAQTVRALADPAAWSAIPALDTPLRIAWAASSAGLLFIYTFAWIRLRIAARRWRAHEIDGYAISVTEHVGPSVMGYLKPRVLLPVWVLSSPGRAAGYVIAHEKQHIDAKDPILWMASLLLLAVVPWNVPLWWQLRQLRFAIESDCDARVVKRTQNARKYASALLEVAKYRGSMQPEFTLGSSLRGSQIERRVALLLSDQRPATVSRQVLLLTASLAFALLTGVMQVPEWTTPARSWASDVPEIFRRVEMMALARHKEFFQVKYDGVPVVFMVMSPDGVVEESSAHYMEPAAAEAVGRFQYMRCQLGLMGLPRKEIWYVGGTRIRLPRDDSTEVVVYFAGRRGTKLDVEDQSLLFPPGIEPGSNFNRRWGGGGWNGYVYSDFRRLDLLPNAPKQVAPCVYEPPISSVRPAFFGAPTAALPQEWTLPAVGHNGTSVALSDRAASASISDVSGPMES